MNKKRKQKVPRIDMYITTPICEPVKDLPSEQVQDQPDNAMYPICFQINNDKTNQIIIVPNIMTQKGI